MARRRASPVVVTTGGKRTDAHGFSASGTSFAFDDETILAEIASAKRAHEAREREMALYGYDQRECELPERSSLAARDPRIAARTQRAVAVRDYVAGQLSVDAMREVVFNTQFAYTEVTK